jgi:type I restriction enzyme S subunit
VVIYKAALENSAHTARGDQREVSKVGGFGMVPPELDGAVVSSHYFLFTPHSDTLLPDYLGYYSRTAAFRDQVTARGSTNYAAIRPGHVLGYKIPLPPIEEQRRIVGRIEYFEAKVNDARVLRSRAAAEIELFRRTGFRTLLQSVKGETVHLEAVCSEIIDCLHSNPIYSDSGVPTLRSPDVGWGTLFLDAAKKTSLEEYDRRTRRGELEPGDIVVVREGGGTGKAGMIEDGQRASLGQRVMQLRPDRNKVLPRFLLFQWLSPMIQQDQIAGRMKGSASPHLNIGAIRQFAFVLPSFKEQRRAVSEIERLITKIDTIRQAAVQSETAMSALLPSILDRAFADQL